MSQEENKEQKRSFVDDRDAPPPERKDSPVVKTITVNGKPVRVLEADVALTLLYGKADDILTELKMLNSVFSKVAEPKYSQTPAQPPVQQPVNLNKDKTPESPTSTAPLQMPKPTEQTPRIKEILVALEPVKDLLNIDVESSAMFVMIKPAAYLGQENFRSVASIVRNLGGQYVSAGKASHFEVPKAPLRK